MKTNLSKPEENALLECGRYANGFWWKPEIMARLALRGLAERRYLGGVTTDINRPYFLTPKGRELFIMLMEEGIAELEVKQVLKRVSK